MIETERLRLREFRPGDENEIRRMLSDPVALRFFRPIVEAPGFPRTWIERNTERYARDGHGLWALERKADGRFVGDCGLTWQIADEETFLEVGYHLSLEARGHGFAGEAARACLAWGFANLDVDRITSMVSVGNEGSKAVATKLHARRLDGWTKGGLPIHLFVTTREEYEARRGD